MVNFQKLNHLKELQPIYENQNRFDIKTEDFNEYSKDFRLKCICILVTLIFILLIIVAVICCIVLIK